MAAKTPKTTKGNSRKSTQVQQGSTVTPINRGDLAAGGSRTAAAVEKETRLPEPMIEQRIRVRAYELFEQRGRVEGFDQEDWARAEAEILAKFERGKSA